MNDETYRAKVRRLAADDPAYDIRVYDFISAAVSHTVRRAEAENRHPETHHVSGRELIAGMIEFALERYGFLAPLVFRFWKLQYGFDAGYLIFRMIDAGILAASDDDRIEDFDCSDDLPSMLEAVLRRTAGPDGAPIASPPLIA